MILHVQPEMSVAQLKRKICKKLDVAPSDFWVRLGSKPLDDRQLLSAYNVGDAYNVCATLHMSYRLLGGGKDEVQTAVGVPMTLGAPPEAQLQSASTSGKTFAAFLSHAKADAAMHARFLFEKLEVQMGGARIFLDSDDLRDLRSLLKHVQDSEVLLLLQTPNVNSRPCCLLEMLTALDNNIPIIAVCLMGQRRADAYDFAYAEQFLANLDTMLDDGCTTLLATHGYADMRRIAWKLFVHHSKSDFHSIRPLTQQEYD